MEQVHRHAADRRLRVRQIGAVTVAVFDVVADAVPLPPTGIVKTWRSPAKPQVQERVPSHEQ